MHSRTQITFILPALKTHQVWEISNLYLINKNIAGIEKLTTEIMFNE